MSDWDLDVKKRVVAEKYDIEYGDESKLLAHLDTLDNQNSEATITTIFYLIKDYCKTLHVFDWELAGRN